MVVVDGVYNPCTNSVQPPNGSIILTDPTRNPMDSTLLMVDRLPVRDTKDSIAWTTSFIPSMEHRDGLSENTGDVPTKEVLVDSERSGTDPNLSGYTNRHPY